MFLTNKLQDQNYFSEWKWYPLFNACGEVFKNTSFKGVFKSYLQDWFSTYYFSEWKSYHSEIMRRSVYKHIYKEVYN